MCIKILYLGECEREARDAEEDFSSSENNVLRKQPKHVNAVRIGDLFNVHN